MSHVRQENLRPSEDTFTDCDAFKACEGDKHYLYIPKAIPDCSGIGYYQCKEGISLRKNYPQDSKDTLFRANELQSEHEEETEVFADENAWIESPSHHNHPHQTQNNLRTASRKHEIRRNPMENTPVPKEHMQNIAGTEEENRLAAKKEHVSNVNNDAAETPGSMRNTMHCRAALQRESTSGSQSIPTLKVGSEIESCCEHETSKVNKHRSPCGFVHASSGQLMNGELRTPITKRSNWNQNALPVSAIERPTYLKGNSMQTPFVNRVHELLGYDTSW